jgi:CheY-like chemotaxis protein
MRWTPLVLVAHARAAEREMYADSLRGRGFSVLQAVDGAEAMWIAADFVPDVISLDLVLPKIDGLALGERLKADPRTASIRLVAVTSLSFGAVLTHARAVGVERILTRPCRPERLTGTIADLLGWPGGYRRITGEWCTG